MKQWIKRRAVVHILIVGAFLLTWGLLDYYQFDFLVKGEKASIDNRIRFGRKADVNPNLVFLAIDTASVSSSQLSDKTVANSKPLTLMRAGYPYSREVYADICERLLSAGAKVVAFDIFFQSPKPEDSLWKAALDKYRKHVVIGMNFSDDLQDGFSTTLTLPPSTLFPDQDPSDDRLAYLNFKKDNYGVVRDVQYRDNIENRNRKMTGAEELPKLYSFASRTVQKAEFSGQVPEDLSDRVLRFAGKPETVFPTYSLYKIFDPDIWDGATFRKGDFFKGKIVVVGPQGDWTKDELVTPWGLMNGAELHLNAINDLLQNDFLYPSSKNWAAMTALTSAALALLLGIGIVSILWRFLAGVVIIAGYTTAMALAYNGPGWLLPAMAPTYIFCGAMGVGFVYDFTLAQIEKVRLRATFERYHSKNVVK